MPGHLESIVRLQQTLTALDHARQRLESVPDWMRELHDEHSTRRAEIEASEEALEEAGRERRAAEGDVDEARDKQKRYQQQINQVSTQREYGALLQEIDTVKRQIVEGEERGLSALERADALGGEVEEKQAAFADLDQRYATELARWESEKPAVAAQVAELEAEAATLRSALPRNVLGQFERLVARYGGGALAPIRKVERGGRAAVSMWHCGACNYRVRPQSVVMVRNEGALQPCDSCQRILYLED
jgi:predicted  nucleic acid-binding Zn-ribbon protein